MGKVFAFIFMLFVISALDCKNLAKARKGATTEDAPQQAATVRRAEQECKTTEEELNEIEAQTHRELENKALPKGARQEMAHDIEKKFNFIKEKVKQVATHLEEVKNGNKTHAIEGMKKIKERIHSMEIEAKKKFADLFDGKKIPVPRKIANKTVAENMLNVIREQIQVANATLNTIVKEGQVDPALSNSVKKSISHAILARFDEVRERGGMCFDIFRRIHKSKFIAKEKMEQVGQTFEELEDKISEDFPAFGDLMDELRRGDGKRPPHRPDGKRPPRPDGKRPDGPKDEDEEEGERRPSRPDGPEDEEEGE